MERNRKPLTTRDIVLLITHASDDEVGGRTVMQKLAYFTSLNLKSNLEHRAHFFGPFSSKVEDAISNAVVAGELHETVERFPDWHGGPDVRKYTYMLTGNGKKRVNNLIEHERQTWDVIDRSVSAISDALPGLDQKTLSAAAKTYLIVSESAGPVELEKIPALARRLGWHLEDHQVDTTVSVLKKLDLLEN